MLTVSKSSNASRVNRIFTQRAERLMLHYWFQMKLYYWYFYVFKEWFDKWTQSVSEKGRFLKAISRNTALAQREKRRMPIFRSCDMSAMATAIDPDTVLDAVDVFATVEVKGQFTRGMMVADWRGILEKNKNVKVVKKIDTLRARELFNAIVEC